MIARLVPAVAAVLVVAGVFMVSVPAGLIAAGLTVALFWFFEEVDDDAQV